MRRVRSIVALAVTVVVGLGLAGCDDRVGAPGLDGETSASAARSPLTSVVMVGDSITDGARAGLEFAFKAKGFSQVIVDAQWGRRIKVGDGTAGPLNGLQAVKNLQAAGANPDVWIVALGTNDLGQYNDAADYGAVIDEMLALIPADKPLVWVNTFRANQLDDTVLYNLTLQAHILTRGNAIVTDWYGIASKPDQTVLSNDGVHPTRDGYGIFALTVADSLAAIATS